jgi:hypothetical protein
MVVVALEVYAMSNEELSREARSASSGQAQSTARSTGIRPGDAVLVIRHLGEQEIAYNALVERISMRPELAGAKGEPAIKASFVAQQPHVELEGTELRHATVSFEDIVHISHVDWIERRAGLGYEELPGAISGMCRYCRCTQLRACAGGCGWLDAEKTACSAQNCLRRWKEDNSC